MNIFHLTYYIITYFHKEGEELTHLKLQKLLYYVKSWGIVSGVYKVNGDFQAWKNGPVNNDIYESYKKYGANPILFEKEAFPISDTETKEVIDFVLESYAPYQAYTLSAMTHSEKPWTNTLPNEIISEELIYNYYKEQPFAKNFPLTIGKTYYPVYTDFLSSFILDMDKNDSAANIHFNSFSEYKNFLNTSKPYLEELIQQIAPKAS